MAIDALSELNVVASQLFMEAPSLEGNVGFAAGSQHLTGAPKWRHRKMRGHRLPLQRSKRLQANAQEFA